MQGAKIWTADKTALFILMENNRKKPSRFIVILDGLIKLVSLSCKTQVLYRHVLVGLRPSGYSRRAFILQI